MGKKKGRVRVIIGILLFIILGLPLIVVGVSFIGRVTPDSVIPDSFDIYVSVPNPVRLASRVLGHESLPDIMSLAEMAPLLPLLNQVKDSGLAENFWVKLAARGRLDAAFLGGGRLLASWNAGVISPLLRLLPFVAGWIDVPGLYYVKAGKNSRFEYRLEDGTVYFISPFKNLLVISNNSTLFESVLGGSSRDGDILGFNAKTFNSRNHDAAFLLTPEFITNAMRDSDIPKTMDLLQFSGPIEASLTILPKQLKLNIVSPLRSNNEALRKIIERNSQATPISAMIPDSAQYLTLLSAGSLAELLDAVVYAIKPGGTNWEGALRTADSSARVALGMNVEELLFSWSGTQFAVYGLEGRPNPVIAVEIKDENKRREVFDKAFRSVILNENIQLNLDGNRIPRIEVPNFLHSFLKLLKLDIPSPYYTVHNNYLFVSESAETLLAAVNAVRRNEVLPKTDLWRTLSQDNSGPSSFNLFYSIDPSIDSSLPFFLKGSGEVSAVLRLYRQGLARLFLENSVLSVSLQAIPGAGSGIVPVMGFPLDFSTQGRTGSSLYHVSSGKDSRFLFTRGSDILILNPLDRSVKELQAPGASGANFYAIPVAGDGAGDGAVWVVDSRGNVSLVNKDMENLSSFPISTGIRLSAAPGAWGGKLFLCDEDGSIYTVDNKASVNQWGIGFSEALRSPPSFMDFRNRSYAASYLKSFLFGGLYLQDQNGSPLQNWPVTVSAIAFGSPLLFNGRQGNTDRLLLAFITQAGRLTVYTENAQTLSPFPLDLEGVFYLQPVFDGECLWIIESEGTLYRIGLDGEILSHKIPRLSVREGGFITVADISAVRRNARAPKEAVFFTGEGNALYGYTRNFAPLDGFPLPVWGRPLIGDLHGSGKIEVAGVGMDNKLYLWQFR